MNARVLCSCIVGFGLVGCAGEHLVVEPARLSSFGHETVRLESERLSLAGDERVAVRVGGVAAYDVLVEAPRALSFVVQSAALPGSADVEVLIEGDEPLLFEGAVSFDSAVDARFTRLLAFGASITMGTESMSVNVDSQLFSPAAQLARAAGAALPMPLIKRGKFEGVTLDAFDPQTCKRVDESGPSSGGMLDAFYDPELDEYVLEAVRVDPELAPWNIAVGGARVVEVLDGYLGQTNVLALVTTEPELALLEITGVHATPQVELAEAIDPLLAVSFDLLCNDFSYALHEGLVPELVPSDEEIGRHLDEIFARLRADGAEVFVANMPPLALVPDLAKVVDDHIADGEDPDDVVARYDAISARVPGMNRALEEAARAHGVHVFDFYALAAELLDEGGTEIGGERLGFGPLEGIVSLDGLHLTRTANAFLANKMIDVMNEALAMRVPAVDVEGVMRDDPLAPPRLREAGFSCAGAR